jgi:hypothetical protein
MGSQIRGGLAGEGQEDTSTYLIGWKNRTLFCQMPTSVSPWQFHFFVCEVQTPASQQAGRHCEGHVGLLWQGSKSYCCYCCPPIPSFFPSPLPLLPPYPTPSSPEHFIAEPPRTTPLPTSPPPTTMPEPTGKRALRSCGDQRREGTDLSKKTPRGPAAFESQWKFLGCQSYALFGTHHLPNISIYLLGPNSKEC